MSIGGRRGRRLEIPITLDQIGPTALGPATPGEVIGVDVFPTPELATAPAALTLVDMVRFALSPLLRPSLQLFLLRFSECTSCLQGKALVLSRNQPAMLVAGLDLVESKASAFEPAVRRIACLCLLCDNPTGHQPKEPQKPGGQAQPYPLVSHTHILPGRDVGPARLCGERLQPSGPTRKGLSMKIETHVKAGRGIPPDTQSR